MSRYLVQFPFIQGKATPITTWRTLQWQVPLGIEAPLYPIYLPQSFDALIKEAPTSAEWGP